MVYELVWEPTESVEDGLTVALTWEENVRTPRRAHLPRMCSCGLVDCPDMVGATVFLPEKDPRSVPSTPSAAVTVPEDDDAEVGADAFRQLAELRAQIARLEQNGHDQNQR
jgi:hypothetical protein